MPPGGTESDQGLSKCHPGRGQLLPFLPPHPPPCWWRTEEGAGERTEARLQAELGWAACLRLPPSLPPDLDARQVAPPRPPWCVQPFGAARLPH